MPTSDEWKSLIREAPEPEVLTPHTYLNDRKERSRASPFKVATDEGDYYVKGRLSNLSHGKELSIDQIAGYLGYQMSAPVAPVALMELPEEFFENEQDLEDVCPGVAHATEAIPGCTNKHKNVAHLNAGDNRNRFSKLAVFFGWIFPHDAQVIYKKQEPQLVFSVDHGLFLPPPGTGWSKQSLQQHTDSPTPWENFVNGAQLSQSDESQAARALQRISDSMIAEAVSRPHESWNITEDERVAVARFLANRRDELVSTLTQGDGDDD